MNHTHRNSPARSTPWRHRRRALLMLGGFALAQPLSATGAETVAATAEQEVIIRVDGTGITRGEFTSAFRATARERFYHGTPPEAQIERARREVAEEMIMRILLLGEADRLALQPDADRVAAALARYESKYADQTWFAEQRDTLLPRLTTRLREDDLLRQLEDTTRAVGKPDARALADYYAQHPEKFTEPAQYRLSVLLIGVPAHAPANDWANAQEEARDLVERIAAGESFSALARAHSADASATNGGDMGYVHEGMLSPAVQELVRELPIGQVSEPTRLLEGVALLRVEDHKAPTLHSLSTVKSRAADLWRREQGERRWQALRSRLRAGADVEIRDPALRSPEKADAAGAAASVMN